MRADNPDFELAGEAPALQLCVSSIAENLERVRKRIAHAAAKAGRTIDEIELVAITKTHPAEKVREAIEAGQTLFGESRVQEARENSGTAVERALAFRRASSEKQNPPRASAVRTFSQY